MKIIQFVPSLRTGGAETLATNYAIEMSKLGHDVFCFVHDGDLGDSPNKSALLSSNVHIVFLSDRDRWYYKSNDFFSRAIRLNIRRHKITQTVEKINPDVIHFHITPFDVIWRIINTGTKATLFYTIHSELKSIFRDQNNLKLAKKAVAEHKITIIALHDRMKKECVDVLGDENSLCIKNGIDLNRFRKARLARNDYRIELGIAPDELVIGHVGSFAPVKNHEYLLKVFRAVINKRNNSRLLLVGEGSLKDRLIQTAKELGISDRIIWLEKRCDIPQLLSCMDVFVFPSRFEGYPLSVIEAQAVGVRCLVSANITDEVLVTNHIKKMSIELPPEAWGSEILNPSSYPSYSGIEDYDLKKIVKELIELYSGVQQ